MAKWVYLTPQQIGIEISDMEGDEKEMALFNLTK
jgi:hypothetical protein